MPTPILLDRPRTFFSDHILSGPLESYQYLMCLDYPICWICPSLSKKSENDSIALLLWALCLFPTGPQGPDAHRWQLLTYDMASIFRGIGYSYSRPLHWQRKQWSQFGATLGATGLAYLVDGPTSTYFRGIKQDVPKFIRDYGLEYGSPANNYLLTGGVYVAGLVAKDPKLRRTGVLLIASASAAGLLQQILKSAIGRARPVSGEGKATFKPLWPVTANTIPCPLDILFWP